MTSGLCKGLNYWKSPRSPATKNFKINPFNTSNKITIMKHFYAWHAGHFVILKHF